MKTEAEISAEIARKRKEYDDAAFGGLEYPCGVIGARISTLEWVLSAPSAPASPTGRFECAARKQSLPELADCDWPMCGCDPYAEKVFAALEESGLTIVKSLSPAAPMSNAADLDAIMARAMAPVFTNEGHPIKAPDEGKLDEVEQARWNCLLYAAGEARKAYVTAMSAERDNEVG